MSFYGKGMGFLRELKMVSNGFRLKTPKTGISGSQELTLSYLCDNFKLGLPEEDIPSKNLLNSFEKVALKGREISILENSNQNEKWVERDFLNTNETRENSSKREVEEEVERENVVDKKPKLETLNLSLALPDVSLSLTAPNPSQNADPLARPKLTRITQSLAPSIDNPQTTCSNDFSAYLMSYSYSHFSPPFPQPQLLTHAEFNRKLRVFGGKRWPDLELWGGD